MAELAPCIRPRVASHALPGLLRPKTPGAPAPKPQLLWLEPLDPSAWLDLLWRAHLLGLPLTLQVHSGNEAWQADGLLAVTPLRQGRWACRVGDRRWQWQEADWTECQLEMRPGPHGLRSRLVVRAPDTSTVCTLQDMLGPPSGARASQERCAWRTLLSSVADDHRGATHGSLPLTKLDHPEGLA